MREALGAFGLQWPGDAHLVEADAERPGALIADSEILQRLAGVEIGLAGGHDADTGAGRVDHRLVEAVGAYERLHGVHLGAVQAPLRLEWRVGIADAEPVGRELEIRRQHDLDALGIDPHRGA